MAFWGQKIFDHIITHRWPFLNPSKLNIPYQIIFHCLYFELRTYILELHILSGTALSIKLHNFVIYGCHEIVQSYFDVVTICFVHSPESM